MPSSLFRQQVIDVQKDRLLGEVFITQPLSIVLTTSIIFVTVSCLVIALIYGTYARRERVIGYLTPDKGLIKIYAPMKGFVTKVHIKDGQVVEKNERLFTISTIRSNAEGSDRDAILLLNLKQQQLNLLKKINQQRRLSNAKTVASGKKIDGLQLELAQLNPSIVLETKQLLLSSARQNKLQILLNQGYLSEANFQEEQKHHFDKELQLQSLKRLRVQLENNRNKAIQQQQMMPLQWQSEHADLQRNLSEIKQRMIEISNRRQYSIRSPISGRLTALQISEGQYLTTQSPLIALLPEGARLQAELFLPTRAIGFITIGQRVFLRYSAFPYQHYGLYKGKISSIAHVILAPSELPIPMVLQEPVYRVRVNIDEQSVSAYGKQFSLQAGMLLDADIVLENRSLGQWLLSPLYRLSSR